MTADHLSLYQLTIEDGTAFGDRHARGKLRGLPDEDRSVALYDITQELCDAAGLPAYEVSNHAGSDAQSRHNLIYWRGGDYLGIGPGAHGRLSLGGRRYATEALRAPGAWLSGVEGGGTGEVLREAMSADAQAAEYLMMGMRLGEGISLPRFAAMKGGALDGSRVAGLVDLGLVETEGAMLRTTGRGRLLLNGVIRELAADLRP